MLFKLDNSKKELINSQSTTLNLKNKSKLHYKKIPMHPKKKSIPFNSKFMNSTTNSDKQKINFNSENETTKDHKVKQLHSELKMEVLSCSYQDSKKKWKNYKGMLLIQDW